MPDLPTITVVTPSFNAAATIEETLRSVRDAGLSARRARCRGRRLHRRHRRDPRARGRRPLRVGARPRALARDEQGRRHGAAARSSAGSTRTTVYLPGALRAVGEAFAAQPEAEWAHGPCLIVDGDGREIRRAIDRLQELPPTPLLARALPDAELHLRAGDVRPPRGLSAPSLPTSDYAMSMDYDVFLSSRRPATRSSSTATWRAFAWSRARCRCPSFERQFAEHAEQARAHGAGTRRRRRQPGDEPR